MYLMYNIDIKFSLMDNIKDKILSFHDIKIVDLAYKTLTKADYIYFIIKNINILTYSSLPYQMQINKEIMKASVKNDIHMVKKLKNYILDEEDIKKC